MSKACLRKEVSDGISDVKLFIKELIKLIVSFIIVFVPTIVMYVIMYDSMKQSPIVFVICNFSLIVIMLLWNVIIGGPIVKCYIYPKRDPYA